MKRHLLFGASMILAWLASAPCGAQEWARKMFETTSHDFGTVARGAKAEYAFTFKNIYEEDVRIASVHSTCGCASPRIEKRKLKTYEESAVIASINSKTFLGNQRATITVTIDKPYPAIVQLHLKVRVRTDVMFDPSSVMFGTVEQGEQAERTVRVTYFGGAHWRITGVQSPNPHLSGTVTELSRGSGRVVYAIGVRLSPEAPAGYVREHLTLVTSDAGSSRIPIEVEAHVRPAVSVTPSSLFMGVVRSGGTATKQLVIRGKKPFKILEVVSECGCLEATLPDDPSAKRIHLLPVTFTAKGEPGKMSKTVRIRTDLDGAEVEISAHAVVVVP